jgi:ubiquinone/menaquinone biosynthesis C-methylase UbiE
MSLSSESGIGSAYQGVDLAGRYIDERFRSELNRLLHDRQVGTVNGVIRQTEPRRILEIAPGPARLTRHVQHDGELVCLEYNRGMIEVGKPACAERARWVQGNAFALPFHDESFELVYSFRFIRHFRREDRARLYGEIRRVLGPAGLLVMDAVNRRVSGPLRDASPEAYPIYDKLYEDESDLRSELREAGFAVTGTVAVQRWYSVQHRMQVLLGPRSRWLCRLAIRALERLRPGPSLEWIVTCRRV